MAIWAFSILDSQDCLCDPPAILAEGAEETTARSEATKVRPAGCKLSKGDKLSPVASAQWAARLPAQPRAMLATFDVP
jgi:hypothetical protein